MSGDGERRVRRRTSSRQFNAMRAKLVSTAPRTVSDHNSPPARKSNPSKSLTEAVTEYITHLKYRDLSTNYIESVSCSLKLLIAEFGGSTLVDVITSIALKDFLLRTAETRKWQAKTKRTRQQDIQGFFNYCKEQHMCDEDPSAGLPVIRVPDRVTPPIPIADVEKMIARNDNSADVGCRNLLLLLLMLDTGGRVTEILNIKRSDVDEQNLRIGVIGKDNSYEYLRLSEETRTILRDYLNGYLPESGGLDYLFPSPRVSNKPLTREAIRKIIVRMAGRAGLKGVFPHRFRNTFTSEYVSSGGDAYTLQAELRHKSPQTTKRYLTLFDADISRKHQKHSPVNKLKLPRVPKSPKRN